MKILKEGKLEPEFWWLGKKFSCRVCGCQFEMEKGDYPTNAPIFTLPCPTCKQGLRFTKPINQGLYREYESVFEEVFGKSGLFEQVFGKGTKSDDAGRK